MAYGHAMLFALHAGDPGRAAELGARVGDAELASLRDSERAWVYVARASAAIDDEPVAPEPERRATARPVE